MSYPQTEIFNRTELLFGEERMKNLKDKKVIIFGIGGVGSWTAEALVRTGIINLTIVDADKVAVSNINRQVPATTESVGKIKTDAMRQHLLSINPEANITAINSIYSAATQHLFHLEEYDYIVDAIDSLSDKALLIYNATRARKPKLFASMGAALKIDPTRVKVAEFSKVTGCRLAAALRRRFKKSGFYPARKFKCVYSDELLPNITAEKSPAPLQNSAKNTSPLPMTFNKVATNGSLCHITAIFGMTLAGLILEDIYKETAS